LGKIFHDIGILRSSDFYAIACQLHTTDIQNLSAGSITFIFGPNAFVTI
jgi:hypothetical protein